MRMQRKVGILGGTFDPPHMGHLMLAEWAREEVGLDQILFLPAGSPYKKKDHPVQDGADRLKMVELAIAGHEGFAVSDLELSRKGSTYTFETMELLNRLHPQTEYYFIMGSDCLFSIQDWKEPGRIFAACHVIAAARNASSREELEKKRKELEERYGASIRLLFFPEIEISSSEIRKRAAEGRSIRYMVPDGVIRYIEDRGLYRKPAGNAKTIRARSEE